MDLFSASGNSFQQFCVPLRAEIYGLAYKIVRRHHDAEDVVQEVFIRAYRAWPDWYTPETDLDTIAVLVKAWLYKITANMSKNHCRVDNRRRYLETGQAQDVRDALYSEELVEPDTTSADTRQTEQKVSQALGKLRPRWKQIIELKYWRGLAPEEIARRLGCPKNTVRSGLIRAHEKLKPILRTHARTFFNFDAVPLLSDFSTPVVDTPSQASLVV